MLTAYKLPTGLYIARSSDKTIYIDDHPTYIGGIIGNGTTAIEAKLDYKTVLKNFISVTRITNRQRYRDLFRPKRITRFT